MKTKKQKRKFIDRALSSGRYDHKFVALARKQAQSNHNLNNVIDDINNYHSSKRGIQKSNTRFVVDTISTFETPILVTLTTRYDTSINIIKKRYDELVVNASKKLFGRAYKRYTKMIGNIGYIEGAEGNIHIHAVLDRPDHTKMTAFRKVINDSWQYDGGFVDFDVISESDADYEAIAHYMTKVQSKEGIDTMQEALVIH